LLERRSLDGTIFQHVKMSGMPRPYRATHRAESVANTRARILEATRALLPDATDIPVDRIAATAGVSVQTLYTQFGSKRGLLLALIDSAQRDVGAYADFERVWQSRDGETALRRMLEATFRIWHGLWPFVEFTERARRSDPEILRYLREVDGYRLANLRSITDQLALEGRLRTDLDAVAAADLAFSLSTPSTYDELVRVREWSPQRATTAVTEAVVAGVIDFRARDDGAHARATPADWSSALRAPDAINSAAGLDNPEEGPAR
jgi:AcrR family transcriptional regulator